jgi:hypothetical protein
MTAAKLYKMFAKIWFPDGQYNWRSVPKEDKAKWVAMAEAVNAHYRPAIDGYLAAIDSLRHNANGGWS